MENEKYELIINDTLKQWLAYKGIILGYIQFIFPTSLNHHHFYATFHPGGNPQLEDKLKNLKSGKL